jgi:tRNA pseudouridine synthase 10
MVEDPKTDDADTMLKKAAKALERPLCDRCLGRLYARSGFGLTNAQRGAAMRTMLGMVIDGKGGSNMSRDALSRVPIHHPPAEDGPKVDPSAPEEGWHTVDDEDLPVPWTEVRSSACWLCEDLFDRIPAMRELIISEAKGFEFSNFQVGTTLEASISYREQRLWEDIEPTSAEPLKEEFNRELGKALFEVWTDKMHERGDPEITFISDPSFLRIRAQVKPIFIYGRYNKYERGIPQTRWICTRCNGRGCESCGNTGKRYQTSVEELIGVHFQEAASGTDFKMHGMGREDIDVRTLGRGRPFVLEISEPRKRTFDLRSVVERVNSSTTLVSIGDVRWTDRAHVQALKESRSLKTYEARITLSAQITEESLKYGISLLGRSPIQQRTPDRVSHRRADLMRERRVHEIEATIGPDGIVTVRMKTDAGLYIKELMHGDNGRTNPSLAGALGCEVVVRSLDVLQIEDGEDPSTGE